MNPRTVLLVATLIIATVGITFKALPGEQFFFTAGFIGGPSIGVSL